MATEDLPLQQITEGRPCTMCGQYLVGAENAWLCFRCGFDGPHAEDLTDEMEAAP